jgi:hypothetical protein
MRRPTRESFLMRMAPDPETAMRLHALGTAIRQACEDTAIPVADIALMLNVLALDFAREGGAEAQAALQEEEPDDERPH